MLKIKNIKNFLFNFLIKEHIFYSLYIDLFKNDEHYIVSENGWLIIDKATPKELRSIIENSKKDPNYVVSEKFIENLRKRK
jgi:hypothetical protein